MKIIFCRWNSICEDGISNAIVRLGHTLVPLDRKFNSVDYDKEYLQILVKLVQDNPDAACVITVNYHPIVARACKALNKPYLSWTVDCPSFPLYSKTISYPTNRIFTLEPKQAEKFYQYNPGNVFNLPLGCDLPILEKYPVTPEDHKKYDCDISFIGSLYSEKSKYNGIEEYLSDYMKGYVDALINAQMNVYGYFFIEDSMSDEFAEQFKEQVGWIPLPEDYMEDVKGIVAGTYIGYQCTQRERIKTLQAISEHFNMDLWTLSDASMLPNINNRGGADSERMMPKIMKCSKINLNMTNRPIETGITLRTFDIMGCGGFVMTNYQAQIPEYFVPGEDLVMYESIPDLLDKIDYYLTHDEEREQIARNGYEKVKQYHTYDVRLQQMFELARII